MTSVTINVPNHDWLLLYEKDTEIRIISLYRTGTHSNIFEKGKNDKHF